MPRLKTETIGSGDQSWLGSAHGIENCRTELLNISAFTAATHYPDGYIKSGQPVAKVGGLLVPYDDTQTLPAPTLNAPTTATTGGTLAAGTYYYKVTAVNAVGETIGSNEVSQATTGTTSTVGLSWGAVAGATGYKVYRATVSGGQSTSPALVATLGAVTSYTDTGTAVSAGAVPATNGAVVATGSAVLAGLLFTDQAVVGTSNFAVPVLDHGRIRPAKLPQPVTIPGAAAKLANVQFVAI